MVVCGQCGEGNPADAQFCRACQAFLEWEGDRAGEPVPVARPGAEPVPVQPAEPMVATSYRPPPEPQEAGPLSPGDLVCGRCGTGNASTRRFCRRCAAPLVEAVVVRPPWWHRLLFWRRDVLRGSGERGSAERRNGGRRSGERPRRRVPVRSALRAVLRGLRWAVALLLVLGVLGYGLLPPVRGRVDPTARTVWHKARSVFSPDYVPVRPVSITSNGDLPDHPAALISDTINTNYWAVPEGGPEPTLVFTFEGPVDLRQAIFYNGAALDFQKAHRVRQLHLVFSTGRTADVMLRDIPGQQTVDLPGSPGADRVEMHVVSLYHAPPGPNLAIAEIEFFEQRP
jgi:ribosomal protein L40E